MLLERSELQVRAGMADGFTAAMNERGLALLAGVDGVKSVKLGRGVENPDKFMLLVEWDSMDAHAAYSENTISTTFRQLLGPFVTGGAMEHFNMA